MDELTTLATLGTVAGAAAITLVIVQYIKPLLPKIDTRLMVLVIALLLTQVAAIFTGAGDLQVHLLAVLNAFVAATSAMGAYEVTLRKGDEAKKAAAAEEADL
jgi:membrane protein required for beta-lactamase induction